MSGLNDVFAVALGGCMGAVMRHLITTIATSIAGIHAAVGTTIANLLGCFAIGLLIVMAGDEMPAWWTPRMALAARVGMIGSLTTFSTFIAESVVLWGESRHSAVAIYVFANLIIGGFVLVLAMRTGRALLGAG